MKVIKKYYKFVFELYKQIQSNSPSYPIIDVGTMVRFVEKTRFCKAEYVTESMDRAKFLKFLVKIWKLDK